MRSSVAWAGRIVFGMSTPSESQQSAPAPGAPWTSRQLLSWIQSHLQSKDVDAPRVCAELLVAHVLGCDRLRLYMEPDREASEGERAELRALVGRAAAHEPVQFLVGQWPFHGRSFEVAPCTLIPRPATEALVERALQAMQARGPRASWRVLDVGTGSGCIAVSLAASLHALRIGRVSDRISVASADHGGADMSLDTADDLPVLDLDLQPVVEPVRPDPLAAEVGSNEPDAIGALQFIATDVVDEALALAQRNATAIGVHELIQFRSGSLFEPLHEDERGTFNMICSNPPYVSDAEFEQLDRNVREYEPGSALRGGVDGLDFIGPLISHAPEWLCEGGVLLIEIGDAQHDRVRQLAEEAPGLRDVEIIPDFEGFHRVLYACAE